MKETQLLERLERAQKDSQWVSESYDELQEKYEGKVFAVKDQGVVEAAETVDDLMSKLQARGEDPSLFLIEAIPPKGISFIL
jgi:4-aminobutyrate aminotransferase-like enzyme